MSLFSMRTLAVAWTGLASAAAAGAVALQTSYVPPAPPAPKPQPVAVTEPVIPQIASVPFENRSLLAMLPPPDIRPRPAAPRMAAAEPLAPLPIPPVPPAPMHMARSEPRHYLARPAPEPAYAAVEPYAAWNRRLPYPGQYAMERSYYGGGYGRGYGPYPGPYGWQSQY